MPKSGVSTEDGRSGGWRRLTPSRWAAFTVMFLLKTMTVYNVFNGSPSTEWASQSPRWEKLRNDIGAVSDFYPLTVKALYVTGIIFAACRSIDILLNSTALVSTTYFSAYAIYASVVDLLGRCIRGNDTVYGSTRDITAGFQWLAQPELSSYATVPEDRLLVTTKTSWGTTNGEYTIRELIAMRHFAAHGQASSRDLRDFDYNILGEMPPILAKGVEEYLKALESNAEPCIQLAKACVAPYRSRPIFDILWQYHGRGQPFPVSVGNGLREFDWIYKPRAPTFDDPTKRVSW